MKRYKTGLVVGKFSPLHKGHEVLINTAVEKCEDVYLFSYSNPEFAHCGATNRELWLKSLFPSVNSFVFNAAILRDRYGLELPPNDADDKTHRTFVGMLWLRLVNKPLEAVFTSEQYGDGFATELTRLFKSLTDYPTVQHELVDLLRKTVSINGTALRGDIHGLKEYVSPPVYASFVKRICFLGAESTGKSTIARAMAEVYQTNFVPEYGREFWEKQAGILKFEDLLAIAVAHIRNEEQAALSANEFLFVDTSPLTTMLYSYHLFGEADHTLIDLSFRAYDGTFLCYPDFPFVQDGTRSGEAFRQKQNLEYMSILKERRIDFEPLTGPLGSRISRVRTILGK